MSQQTDGTLEFQDEQSAEQKAAELAERVAILIRNDVFSIGRQLGRTNLLPQDFADITKDLILRELKLAELVTAKEHYEQLKANGPKCSGCASIMFTGGLWPETRHDDQNCLLKEVDNLRSQAGELQNQIAELLAERHHH